MYDWLKLAVSGKSLWALYGTRYNRELTSIDGPFEDVEECNLVAIFTSETKAREYVRQARLKNPQPRRGFNPPKVFRANTLLSEYEIAEIEEYHPEDYLVDPEI